MTKNMLVSPKDKEPIQHKSGIIYWYKYNGVDCDDEYWSIPSHKHMKLKGITH